MSILLGAIADDFTGATDLANTLVQNGMRTRMICGLPAGDQGADYDRVDAIVIALKSRSNPVDDAVEDSLAALDWLESRGVRQVFFKYCSTFDSTPAGNIGPVADALAERLDARTVAVCPAFPTNGRTIYMGHLFVGDQLLSDSSMKDHPLTPMTDASLVRLMDAQSRYSSGLVSLPTIRQGGAALDRALVTLAEAGHRYAVMDAVTDEDLLHIGRSVRNHRLVTGGSGVALGLPMNFRESGLLGEIHPPDMPRVGGRSVVLAGSCSEATRMQVQSPPDSWPHLALDAAEIAAGSDPVAATLQWLADTDPGTPALVYTSMDPDQVAGIQAQHGRETAGERIEQMFAALARELPGLGVGKLVVAGGETSGAVVRGLGVQTLEIGPEIVPGVPWTRALGRVDMALALKSGNFGGPDFFERALAMIGD